MVKGVHVQNLDVCRVDKDWEWTQYVQFMKMSMKLFCILQLRLGFLLLCTLSVAAYLAFKEG